MNKLICCLLLVLISQQLMGQADLREKHYLYDLDADVQFDHKLVVSGKQGALYFKVSLKEGNTIGQYLMRYTKYSIINDVISTSTDTLKIRSSLIAMHKNEYYFKIGIPLDKVVNFIVVSLSDINSTKKFEFFINDDSDAL